MRFIDGACRTKRCMSSARLKRGLSSFLLLFSSSFLLYGKEEPLETCAILTTDANDLAKEVHDRMPVILTGDDALAWMDPNMDDTEKRKNLLRPYPPDKMACYAVGPMVGNVRNNSPDCIKPE